MLKFLLLVFSFCSFSIFAQDIYINEICTKNNNVIPDVDFNQFADWIELYNNSSSGINISGFFISDDPNEKTKWIFPEGSFIDASSYLLVWADDRNITIQGHHANFKLSSGSGYLIFSDADANVLDILEYAEQLEDISFGKSINGWAYFAKPTPGSYNNSQAYYSSVREDPPSFSLSSGFYTPDSQIIINSTPGKIVRYTTDGSMPTALSNVYSTSIALVENTVIRARTFGNKLPSEEVYGTYFIQNNKDLPIVSLIIDPVYLWSDSIGIYNDNEIELRKNWERHSVIQYFSDKEMKFEAPSNIRLFGNTAFLLPQKSLAVFPDDPINYQLFDNKPIFSFDSFILRSSSDDWSQTMFRDGLTHTIIGENLKIDYLSFLPTILFINGEYFGIHNMREKNNEDYLKSNHGIDKNKIDFLNIYYPGFWYDVMAGSGIKFNQLVEYLYNNDITDENVFAGVTDYLDIDNYTTYIITQIFVGNGSYNHNIKTWRRNDTIDGFKWLIFDTDRGFTESWRNDFSMIYSVDTVFKRLLENINYRNHYLQQTCSHINSSFRKSYVNRVIDSLQENIEAEMPFHIAKWGPTGGISSMDSWYQNVQVMHNFTAERKDTLLSMLKDYFDLDGIVEVHLKKTSSSGGDIYIENVLIPYNDSTHAYFKNIPITLVVKPHLGYSFIDWEGISNEDTITLTLNSNTLINARFEADCDIPNIITEDAALLKDCSPYYFVNDLFVEPGATLYCEPGVEINFGENVHLYVKGNLSFTGTEQDPIVIQGTSNQVWKYIEMDSGNIVLNHVIIYSGEKAIHFFNGGKLSISNSIFYESNVNLDDLISGTSSEVEIMNNIFYGNSANTKTDCIDCKNIVSGVFSGNKFYNVTDDCIDIGTNSVNVTIDHNEAYYAQSMGFSIGENSEASIFRNIAAHCNGGIQVHTGATASIVNNTLFDNEVGVLCYHYNNTPNSGGTAHVSNTIFSQNILDYALQPNSIIEITYSISDNELLSGVGNITGDPQFINSSEDNFHLKSTSPCIDAGDILSEFDPDNTRADIGALYFDQFNGIHQIEQTVFVYPNPFSIKFYIMLLNGQLIKSIELFNLLGDGFYVRHDINNSDYVVETDYKGLVILRVTDNQGNSYTAKLMSK